MIHKFINIEKVIKNNRKNRVDYLVLFVLVSQLYHYLPEFVQSDVDMKDYDTT